MATYKQKEAFKKVVKGSSLTKAMKDVGYADSTSKRTNKLTNTLGWKELLEKYIPDKDLAVVHKQGLKATKLFTSQTEPDKVEPDFSTRHKYLDTAYKLKGKYAPEKFETEIKNILTEEQIDELLKYRETKKNNASR